MYRDLAWIWPLISPQEEYDWEGDRYASVLEGTADGEVRTLLHLGCGGGCFDLRLSKHFQVTGIELAPAMLELARELNPDVEYLEGDMRTLRLGRTFDAVLVADSIGYMLTEDDLRAAFTTAWDHLRPGGAFLTVAEQTRDTWGLGNWSQTYHTHGERAIALHEVGWDPDPVGTEVEWAFVYLISEDDKLRVELDTHRAGLFPLTTWTRLLGEVGFTVETLEMPEGSEFACLRPG